MPDRAVLWSLLGVALGISVVIDLKSRRIPDWVTLPTALLALAFRFARDGLGDLQAGLLSGVVAALGAAGFFALWALRRNGMGWGDVKLVLAVGAVFGGPLMLAALAFIAVCGFVQALVTLIWRGEVGARLASLLGLKRDAQKPLYIPFSLAIALGCFWAMWWDHGHG